MKANDLKARSLAELADKVAELSKRGVRLDPPLDAATLAYVVQFERERIGAGITEARAKGVRIGRPPSLTAEQRKIILESPPGWSNVKVAGLADCHINTVQRLRAAASRDPATRAAREAAMQATLARLTEAFSKLPRR